MPAISVFFSRDFTDWNVRGCQQPWVLFLKYYPLLRLFQRIYISWGWDFPTAKKIHLRAYWCLRKSKIFVHSIERHGGTWMHMRYLIRLIFDSFFLKFLKFTTDNFNPRKGLNSRQAELQILPQSWLQVLFIGRVLLSGIWLGSRSVQYGRWLPWLVCGVSVPASAVMRVMASKNGFLQIQVLHCSFRTVPRCRSLAAPPTLSVYIQMVRCFYISFGSFFFF